MYQAYTYWFEDLLTCWEVNFGVILILYLFVNGYRTKPFTYWCNQIVMLAVDKELVIFLLIVVLAYASSLV
jgi:hypothetical protein